MRAVSSIMADLAIGFLTTVILRVGAGFLLMKSPGHEEDFVIDRLHSSGVITNCYCTSSCGHCLYFFTPKWKKDYIEIGVLAPILEKIRGYLSIDKRINAGEFHLNGFFEQNC